MSNNGGFTGLVIAKVICCGGLVLLAGTGSLAGLGGWLSDNAWLVAVAVGLGAAALVLYLRPNVSASEADQDGAVATPEPLCPQRPRHRADDPRAPADQPARGDRLRARHDDHATVVAALTGAKDAELLPGD